MPLLFSVDSIIIVVTALNILGQQTVDNPAKVGISGVAVSGNTDSEHVFEVCTYTAYTLLHVLKVFYTRPSSADNIVWLSSILKSWINQMDTSTNYGSTNPLQMVFYPLTSMRHIV